MNAVLVNTHYSPLTYGFQSTVAKKDSQKKL